MRERGRYRALIKVARGLRGLYVENGIVRRGKHRGVHVDALLLDDPAHIVWIYEKVRDGSISPDLYNKAVTKAEWAKRNKPTAPRRWRP